MALAFKSNSVVSTIVPPALFQFLSVLSGVDRLLWVISMFTVNAIYSAFCHSLQYKTLVLISMRTLNLVAHTILLYLTIPYKRRVDMCIRSALTENPGLD